MQKVLFDKTGKKSTKKVTIDDTVFGVEINEDLITQSVNTYLSNQRQANAHTKNKAEVSGGGKKPWRQKGTGRARHGSSRSPIWKGGGVTFGPTNMRNYKKKLNKKMNQNAIRSVLSLINKEDRLYIFEGLNVDEKSMTKSLANILKAAKLDEGKVYIVQDKVDNTLVRAVNNLEYANVEVVNSLSAYNLLNAKHLVILEPALQTINKYWGEQEKVSKNQATKEANKVETKKS